MACGDLFRLTTSKWSRSGARPDNRWHPGPLATPLCPPCFVAREDRNYVSPIQSSAKHRSPTRVPHCEAGRRIDRMSKQSMGAVGRPVWHAAYRRRAVDASKQPRASKTHQRAPVEHGEAIWSLPDRTTVVPRFARSSEHAVTEYFSNENRY